MSCQYIRYSFNTYSLEKTFDALLCHGLYIRAGKCPFGKEEVQFCRHYVSKESAPDTHKITTIEKLPVPQSSQELKIFQGITGWYWKFIPNYADIARPLTHLTENGREYIWLEDYHKGFKLLEW